MTHSYARGGTYTVALTIVDPSGNLSLFTHTVAVGSPPHAVFSASPSNPSSGFPVAFDAGASTDPNSHGAVVAYGWSFGDGSAPASGPSTSHVYANAGTYTVTLTVTDTFGLTASTAQQVVVDEAPTARVAVKTAHPAARVAVAFDGSGSRDADGSITSYRWSFGDGSPARFGVAPKHVYARAGRYAVTLIVTDSSGHAAIIATTVTVAADSRIVRTSLAAHQEGPLPTRCRRWPRRGPDGVDNGHAQTGRNGAAQDRAVGGWEPHAQADAQAHDHAHGLLRAGDRTGRAQAAAPGREGLNRPDRL